MFCTLMKWNLFISKKNNFIYFLTKKYQKMPINNISKLYLYVAQIIKNHVFRSTNFFFWKAFFLCVCVYIQLWEEIIQSYILSFSKTLQLKSVTFLRSYNSKYITKNKTNQFNNRFQLQDIIKNFKYYSCIH